jgi:hypothetical protein
MFSIGWWSSSKMKTFGLYRITKLIENNIEEDGKQLNTEQVIQGIFLLCGLGPRLCASQRLARHLL